MNHHIQQPGCAVIDRRGIVQFVFNVPPARKLTGKRLWDRQPQGEQEAIHEAVVIAWKTGIPQTVRTGDQPDSLFRQCELRFAPLGDTWLTVTWRLLVAGLLTTLELEVLRLMCEGMSVNAAGRALMLSSGRVWTVKGRLRDKIGDLNNVGLTMWAVTRGLWQPEDSLREPMPGELCGAASTTCAQGGVA